MNLEREVARLKVFAKRKRANAICIARSLVVFRLDLFVLLFHSLLLTIEKEKGMFERRNEEL